MPFIERTTTPSRMQEAPIQNVQLPGGVAPVYHAPTDAGVGAASSFWANLSVAAGKAGGAYIEQSQEEAYLQGKEDSLSKKGMTSQNWINAEAYEHGFNQVTLSAESAKLQVELKRLAEEAATSGKDISYFETRRDTLISQAMEKASAANLDVNSLDHKAWLDSVDNARNTNTVYYDQVSTQFRNGMRMRGYAAESNAAISQVTTNLSTGKLEDAKRILDTQLNRLLDPALTLEQQDGMAATFLQGALQNAQSHGDVKALSEYMVQTNRFKSLPIEIQTRLVETANSVYMSRAQMLSQQFYDADFTVGTADSIDKLPPAQRYFNTLDGGVHEGIISVAQAYQFKDNYYKQQLKLRGSQELSDMLGAAPTTAIAANQGWTVDKTVGEITKVYTQKYGYSQGAARMVLDGFVLNDYDRVDGGLDLIAGTVNKLQNIPYDQIQWKDGKPVVTEDVNTAVTFLYSTYKQYQRTNPQFAERLLQKVPEAVRRGIRDTNSEVDMFKNILEIQKGISEHRVELHPDTPPKELFFDASYAKEYGLQFWGNGKDIGVRTGLWESADDTRLINGRLAYLNNALAAEYTRLVNSNQQSASLNDTIEKARASVVANTFVVEDGTPAGMVVTLPTLTDAEREQFLGSKQVSTMQEALQPMMSYYRGIYPRADSMAMEFNDMEGVLELRIYDNTGTLMKSNQTIRPDEMRKLVQSYGDTRAKQAAAAAKLAPVVVPTQGIMAIDVNNKYDIPKDTMQEAIQQLIKFEGYTDKKGFSVLAVHPTKGTPLNGPEYVKQPGEDAQTALVKFNKYLNDMVLPKVAPAVRKYGDLPLTMQKEIFKTLLETTYHAGNVEAFDNMLQRAMQGIPMGILMLEYSASPLAEAQDERDGSRLKLLEEVGAFQSARMGLITPNLSYK